METRDTAASPAPNRKVIQGPTSRLAPEAIRRIALKLQEKPFKPHPLFVNGHAQTLIGYAWPRRFSLRAHQEDQTRIFKIEKNASLLAHCRWQSNTLAHPTMILVHGLEGSSRSAYMLSAAAKAFRAGFNVVRLNLRNCGATEHLTPTLYNSGMSNDLRAVVKELIERDNLQRIFLVGFSMSGNMALKFAGEDGARLPRQLLAICAVSPSIDLNACAEKIAQRENRLYEWQFMHSLRRRIRRKRKLYPQIYDTRNLRSMRTIRDFDNRFTAVDSGYLNADDYYAHASSLPLIRYICVPTLIIHAQDDPFIPFEPLRDDQTIKENPYVILIAPERGGHVGFISADVGEDRFWADGRLVEFCRHVDEAHNNAFESCINGGERLS